MPTTSPYLTQLFTRKTTSELSPTPPPTPSSPTRTLQDPYLTALFTRKPMDPPTSPRRTKVAVVGSGLAGLTAAYLLNKEERYEVHIFEKASEIGMDSASIVLPVPIQRPGDEQVHMENMHIDVPMRSFQGGYYDRLMKLYLELGIRPEARDFSYSFSYFSARALLSQAGGKGKEKAVEGAAEVQHEEEREAERMRTTLLHNGANGTRGLGLPSELSLPPFPPHASLPNLLRYVQTVSANLSTFLTTCLWLLLLNLYILLLSLPIFRPSPNTTLAQWNTRVRPSSVSVRWTGAGERWDRMMHEVLVPLFSAVCTCSTGDVWAYPAEEILEYIYLTIGTHHYTVPGGSAEVISRLTRTLPAEQIHLSCSVSALERGASTGQTSVVSHSGDMWEGFEHVILATQAEYAAHLLQALEQREEDERAAQRLREMSECARLVPQARAEVVTHTWTGLLPPNETDQRDLNLVTFSPSSSSSPSPSVEKDIVLEEEAATYPIMATHVVPLPAYTHPSQPQVFQTTNPLPLPSLHIPEEHVFSRTIFARAFVSQSSKQAVERSLIRVRRTAWGGKKLLAAGPAQGEGGMWLVGSWVGGGIPLLEGCVASAEVVVAAILGQKREQWERAGEEDERLSAGSGAEEDWESVDGEGCYKLSGLGWWDRVRVYGWFVQDLVRLGWWRLNTGREERERLKSL